MAKGEKQKRLSLTTIEKAALLFMAENGVNESKEVIKFVLFLDRVEEHGLPAIREKVFNNLTK